MRVRTYNDLVRNATGMNNLVNRYFDNVAYDYGRNGGSSEQPRTQELMLPLDVWATPEAFHVSAYLPGINPEDVEITFEGDLLSIQGKLPAAPEGAEFIKRELYHGTFVRKLTINVPVDAERIEAHFHNGLLTLTIPKAEAVKPKQIKIQTS
jgi:HSP20 family protein